MKKASPRYLQLMREMSEWHRMWQNALPTANVEYLDFVHSEYEIAKVKLRDEEARLTQSLLPEMPWKKIGGGY